MLMGMTVATVKHRTRTIKSKTEKTKTKKTIQLSKQTNGKLHKNEK